MSTIKDFGSLNLSSTLVAVVHELGYKSPTAIQAQTIPLLLAGRDLVGQSKTGSGKTAAFTLPLLEKVDLQNRTVQALILCPTRELSVQVAREVRKLGCRHPGLQVAALTGGQPMGDQKRALKNGAHIIVGTPGRTLDHLKRGNLDLTTVVTVVLDEADRMLDMGFADDLKAILKSVPTERQTVLFSATFPEGVEDISARYQVTPAKIFLDEDIVSQSPLEQQFYECALEDKFETLIRILRLHQPEAAIVFCNLKATIVELSKYLERHEVSGGALHGDLEQRDRDRIMALFRNRSLRVLIASDVAARGLDIENLDLVVNLDVPAKPDTYVHRIGRTGRAGNAGLAVTLVTPRDFERLAQIEEFTGKKILKKTLPELKQRDLRAKVLNKDAPMETLYISGGRKDKLRPGDILGALTGEAGRLSAKDIGKIEIHDRFSYVAVAKSVAQVAVAKLRDGRIKGHKFQIKFVRSKSE